MARTLPTPALAQVPAQLIEREAELDLVARGLGDTAAHGSLLLFEGAAGIGKSSLLAAAARLAEGHGALVMRARGGELEVDFPFGVARQLLEPRLDPGDPLERAELLAMAGAAAPVLAGAPQPQEANGSSPEDRLSGMLRLIRRLAERGAALVTVDDVQWADRSSLELLLYLAQRLDDLPVVVACTRTTGETGPNATLVDRLESAPLTHVHRLTPLSEDGIRALLVAAGESEPRDAFVRAVRQESGGVPFLANALLASARAAGIRGDADPGRLKGLGSDAVERATCLRLERLPEGARALAHATAVLHNDATRMLAADVAGLDHFTALEAADVLRRAEILEARPELRFRHGIVRASIYAGLSPRARAGAHVQAARALAAADAPAERTAAHLLEAQRLGEHWALDALWQAGRSALSAGRLQAGIAYMRRALDEDPDPVQRSLLLAELGEAEAASGDPAGTTRLALAVEGAQSSADRARTLERLGGALWLLGQESAAAEAFERALDHAEAAGDHEHAPRLRAGLLLAARLDAGLRVRTIERLAPLLREPGFGRQRDPALLASVAFERALAGRRSVRVAELAERSLEGVLADLDAVPGPECYAACCALLWADSLATAEIALTMALETARRRGNTAAAATISRFRAWTVLKRGRIAHAAADALEASGPAGDGPSPGIPGAATILAEIDIEQGRLDEAALTLHDPAQQTEWDDGPRHAFHLATRGRLHFLRGDPEASLAELLESGRRHGVARGAQPSGAAVALARRDRCGRGGRRPEGHDPRRGGGLAGAHVRRPAAARRGPPRHRPGGPPGERLERLREAAGCLERSPGALDRARALIDLGTELRRVGKRREARDSLRAGMDLAQRCEASMLEARASEELTAAGARPRRQRLSGSEALTPRERQVAQLAARGVRNRDIAQRLFITPKTVEWHLGNAYRKLELHSRGSLIGALGESEALEQSA